MIAFDKWQLPDGEKHLQEWMLKVSKRVDGRLGYQYHKYEAAVQHCKKKLTAVDIGAHVGLLSYWMARDFRWLHAFEPVAAHRECFSHNLAGMNNVTLHACALGEKDGMIGMRTAPTSSGDSYVAGEGDIPMRRLDDFAIQDVSFLKLDMEGSELLALRGGEETIKRCRPVIMVEQKPGHAQRFGLPALGAVTYLQGLGYKVVQAISGDYILTP